MIKLVKIKLKPHVVHFNFRAHKVILEPSQGTPPLFDFLTDSIFSEGLGLSKSIVLYCKASDLMS